MKSTSEARIKLGHKFRAFLTANVAAVGANFCSSSLSDDELELSESEWAAKNRDILRTNL